MRHQAELVVRYFERQELDVEGFQWAGVFKPVADVDDSFALAEPPAHDDWVPQAVQDKGRRTEVRVALTRIREAADKYLSPRKLSVASSETPPSAAHVGDMLADLLGGLEGPAPSTRVVPPVPPVRVVGIRRNRCIGDRHYRRPLPTAPLGPLSHHRPVPCTREPRDPLPPHPPAPGPLPQRARDGAPDAPGSTWWAHPTRQLSHLGGPAPPWMSSSRTDHQLLLRSTSRCALATTAGAWRTPRSSGSSAGRTGRGDTFVSGPIELPPDVVRQFVFEARSDLAIDVETKLGDR